jgi:predicted NodU family carbamoyl transferase
MRKSKYVLGTGLSHHGSACLLKDGEICVAIEKERLTRVKHDGLNDSLAINYCLQAEGITVNDLDLVVQSALDGGNFHYGNSYFAGNRIFSDDLKVPVITISHHLAHAYSTIGRCPFEDAYNILIMDGSGSPFQECMDINDAFIPDRDEIHKDVAHLYYEKDSYYKYSNNQLTTVFKDFSPLGDISKSFAIEPFALHSIGSLYQAFSKYCFRSRTDAGKLMGLAPYGDPGIYKEEIFQLKEGRVFVNYECIRKLARPAGSYEEFKQNFKYYANIAYWVQAEFERAILYILNERQKFSKYEYLCYAGGVALNAVANDIILSSKTIQNLYIQPAAGDNGLAIGCAYYGWLEVLKMKKNGTQNNTSCFGITYTTQQIDQVLRSYDNRWSPENYRIKINNFFHLAEKNFDPEKIRGVSAILQIDIKNYCTYQLIVRKDKIECVKDSTLDTDCIIELSELQFATIIAEPNQFNVLLEAGRIKVSNIAGLNLFAKVIDLNSLSKHKGIHAGVCQNNILNKFYYTEQYIKKAAALLAEGKIIAWFQDGSEFGPRALGRRSILADPRNIDVRDYINAEIKFREDFRPFAPAVLREDVGMYFNNDRESPYMVLVDYVRNEWHNKLRSVVHENNTSRIQTVTPDWNPKFYELLKAFKEITGLSVLLNTSFNRMGMPIVETPLEALNFFYSCNLDYLILDKFIVCK